MDIVRNAIQIKVKDISDCNNQVCLFYWLIKVILHIININWLIG
jgi:hypothetical protein